MHRFSPASFKSIYVYICIVDSLLLSDDKIRIICKKYNKKY